MKKRFVYRHKILIYICCAALIIIASVCIVVNSLRLAHAAGLSSADPVLDSVAIAVLAAVAVIMAWTAFFSGYTLGKKGIVRNIGIFYETIPWDDIVLVRYNAEKTIMLLYYTVKKNGYLKDEMTGAQAKFERVVISPKYYDDFAAAVRKRVPRVPVEVVKKEDESDDD